MPDAAHDDVIVLEVFGEGKTDIGKDSVLPRLPNGGVVPIIVHGLCGSPVMMRVKTKRYAHLEGKGLWQKLRFSKRQAFYNKSTQGAVFVVDTEGDNTIVAQLAKGRDHELSDFPMAIGAPRPCIEAWLLADPVAVRNALGLLHNPDLPEDPEALPAPRLDPGNDPKSVLAKYGANSQAQKDAIARKLKLNAVRQRCVGSFEPFAKEVEMQLRPLFEGR